MSSLSSHASPRVLKFIVAGLLAATAITTTVAVIPATPVRAQTQAQTQITNDASHGFADLVARVMPSVISVDVKFSTVASDGTGQQVIPDLPPDSPFRDFFNQFPQFRNGMPFQGQPQQGLAEGSGFIISADGYAVTNNHVVRNAEEVTVKLTDGSEFPATVIGTDPKTDLALIKIKANRTFQFVKFSNTEPRIGDWVVAVGNPFGLGGTVTSGIISARGRNIGAGPYDDFLQIDAAINKGNSGGPAFNLEGNVVGVNTAIYSPSGGSVGIGFAIPASVAKNVIDSLKANGSVTRGWLGVQIQPVTKDIADSLGLAEAKGAIVADVTPDSPALAAGLKTGDAILKIDGKDVADSRDLALKVAQIPPGTSVPLAIVRDGKTMDVTVKIGTMPGQPKAAMNNPTIQGSSALASLGLQLAPADNGAGVKVLDVAPNSPAADRGLKPGDVILEVAGNEVHGPADVQNAIKSSGKNRILMLVRSGSEQHFIALPTKVG